jgi:hypothetical protein
MQSVSSKRRKNGSHSMLYPKSGGLPAKYAADKKMPPGRETSGAAFFPQAIFLEVYGKGRRVGYGTGWGI